MGIKKKINCAAILDFPNVTRPNGSKLDSEMSHFTNVPTILQPLISHCQLMEKVFLGQFALEGWIFNGSWFDLIRLQRFSTIWMQNNYWWISVYEILTDLYHYTWILFHYLNYIETTSTTIYNIKSASFQHINNTKTNRLSICSALHVCHYLWKYCFYMAAVR